MQLLHSRVPQSTARAPRLGASPLAWCTAPTGFHRADVWARGDLSALSGTSLLESLASSKREGSQASNGGGSMPPTGVGRRMTPIRSRCSSGGISCSARVRSSVSARAWAAGRAGGWGRGPGLGLGRAGAGRDVKLSEARGSGGGAARATAAASEFRGALRAGESWGGRLRIASLASLVTRLRLSRCAHVSPSASSSSSWLMREMERENVLPIPDMARERVFTRFPRPCPKLRITLRRRPMRLACRDDDSQSHLTGAACDMAERTRSVHSRRTLDPFLAFESLLRPRRVTFPSPSSPPSSRAHEACADAGRLLCGASSSTEKPREMYAGAARVAGGVRVLVHTAGNARKHS